MYSSALTISRNATVGGRPGPLGSRSRNSGSNRAHWASVGSLGYAARRAAALSGTRRWYVAIQQLAAGLDLGRTDYTKSRTRSQKHGFELIVDVVNVPTADGPMIRMQERAPLLLDGIYDFLSGLHHETYVYRARGDKRLVYLAQAQNDWDDRIIATPDIRSARDLEGKQIIFTSSAPCVLGNLKHSLQLGGADLERIEFVGLDEPKETICHSA